MLSISLTTICSSLSVHVLQNAKWLEIREKWLLIVNFFCIEKSHIPVFGPSFLTVRSTASFPQLHTTELFESLFPEFKALPVTVANGVRALPVLEVCLLKLFDIAGVCLIFWDWVKLESMFESKLSSNMFWSPHVSLLGRCADLGGLDCTEPWVEKLREVELNEEPTPESRMELLALAPVILILYTF